MQAHKRTLMYLLAAALLLPACSGSVSINSGLDTDKAETEISSGIEEQTDAGVESVECPDDVDIEQGNTFECTATFDDGSTGTIDVTQDDDEGNITWELSQ